MDAIDLLFKAVGFLAVVVWRLMWRFPNFTIVVLITILVAMAK